MASTSASNMNTLYPRHAFRSRVCAIVVFTFLINLVSTCFAEDKEYRPVFRQKPDERVDELKEAQEKARREYREAVVKALEEAKKREQKEKKKRKKEEKEEDEKGMDRDPIVAGRAGTNVRFLDYDPKKKKDKKKRAEMIVIKDGNEESGRRVIQWDRPKDKRKLNAVTEGSQQLVGPDGRKIEMLDPEKPFHKIERPEQDRSLWDKLFGKEDEASGAPKTISQPRRAPVEPTQKPYVSEKDSVLRRLVAEMAVRRLEQEEAARLKSADPKELPKAAVIDPDAAKPSKPEQPTQAKAAAIETASPGVALESAVDTRLQAEQLFQRALASRDMLLREAAFSYAATYRRREAIPFLVKEIKNDDLLASRAALRLGALGPATDEMKAVLLASLPNKDSLLRENAVDALGRLRVPEAVKPLVMMLEAERNYRIRSAICDALGQIGERDAVQALKACMGNKDEVELVKAQAALALARMHDRGGREHLIALLNQPHPAMQVMGLAGLVKLNDQGVPGYLASALSSRFDEVWVAAAYYFPDIGPTRALPVLTTRLRSAYPVLRRRAALAMGMLGSHEGVPYIEESLRVGGSEERYMAATLFGILGRRDKIPLLISKLNDPKSRVRQAVAIALARLDAKDAVEPLIKAAQGARSDKLLPPALRSVLPDVGELATHLACIRILQGADKEMALKTLPNRRSSRWAEFDEALMGQQVELLKAFQVVDVLSDGNRPAGAVLKSPQGRELILREGEPVAAGFRLRSMVPEKIVKGRLVSPAFVTLVKGDTRVTLSAGREPEVHYGGKKEKKRRK